jgi:hypothetical protein
MSDSGSHRLGDREDVVIELALERLGAADPLAPRAPVSGAAGQAAPQDEEEETLLRLHVETLGSLPYALDPVPAPAAVKGRLLAGLAGDETQEVSGLVRRVTLPPPPVATGAAAVPRVAPARSRWPLRLAAMLALALLGSSAWLFLQNQEQRAALVRLEHETRRLAGALGEVGEARANVALLTSRGVAFCPLRPAAGGPPAASGALFVAADHQHWYLAVHGLGPCPQGRHYQLWFHTPQGVVAGGAFDPRPGEMVELGSPTMPAGTRAVSVTLEPATGSQQPSGPQILYGEELTRLL